MHATSSKPSRPLTDSQLPARTWEDVAKEIINEPDSEKLSFLLGTLRNSGSSAEKLRSSPTSYSGKGKLDTPMNAAGCR
jgi:hypothetical protein